MELTAIAQWLNTAFAGYDYAILQALHNLAGAAGGFFTPLCRAITLLGEKGIPLSRARHRADAVSENAQGGHLHVRRRVLRRAHHKLLAQGLLSPGRAH